uniref:Uncharacterized protein n=1 Tax=Florenciella sp. virus SA2 TaxID=3240092 RepID=A0AB39J6M6_9VIRU
MTNKINIFSPNLTNKELNKILFIYNAIEDGWSVKKRKKKYIFTKHKNKENYIYTDDYLKNFVTKYFNIK